ncbi:MAG: hypothetical protein VB858_11380, partial [Planctomycetaceae bacterium]
MRRHSTRTFVTCLLVFSLIVPAGAVDKLSLRRKQIDQQRARAMARKLVSSAITIQLSQLEDNGLTELPIYGEIRSMQKNIGLLVDDEMADVVQLFLNAQKIQSIQKREAAFVKARQTIREIVIKLAIERQNLLKRLKNAEIAEQVKRLINLETEAAQTTKKLPEMATTQKEAAAVRTIEDQRDVKELFLHLVETLADVSKWGGPIGQGAGQGLVILKQEQTGTHLDKAGTELEATRYSSAEVAQAQVISGLKKLLEQVLRTQGVISSDRESLLDQVKELAERQAELRRDVQKGDLSDLQETNEFVKAQNEIREELSQLQDVLPTDSPAETPLQNALEAATEAAEDIFSDRQEEAIESQRSVEGQLANLENALLEDSDRQTADVTAAELSQRVRDLETAREKIDAAVDAATAAQKNLADEPEKSAELADAAQSALEEVQKSAEQGQLTDAVEAMLDSAEDAV